jgi:hypothetical protein
MRTKNASDRGNGARSMRLKPAKRPRAHRMGPRLLSRGSDWTRARTPGVVSTRRSSLVNEGLSLVLLAGSRSVRERFVRSYGARFASAMPHGGAASGAHELQKWRAEPSVGCDAGRPVVINY